MNVPDVKEAFAVNVAPEVMAVPEAVRDVITSPSGSAADTVKDVGTPTFAATVAGAVTNGARPQPLHTMIDVVAERDKAFEAVNVTL